ncbi:hypothetical protein VTN00DRAFT_3403 [Thermoascus crustaceus]|uniref:uncharacterized protein n=1 Tax=Thermoascus crustaceus TaxID=5088 RepID=UPI00374443C4
MNATTVPDYLGLTTQIHLVTTRNDIFSNGPISTLVLLLLRIRLSLIVLGVGALFTLYSTQKTNTLHFRHFDGRKLQLLEKDTRYLRFSHGRELSKEGEERCGDDPYLVKNGSKLELVLFNPTQVRDFFDKDARDHRKKPDANMGQYFLRSLGQCVGVQNGERWHKTRRHLEAHFSAPECASMILDFQSALDDWAEKLPADFAANSTTSDGFFVDSVEACRQLPFRMIALSLYGDMLTEEIYERLWDLNKIHEKVTEHTFFGTWENMPFYRYLPTAANRALKDYQHGWKEFNLHVITEARKTGRQCRAESMFGTVESGELTMDMFLQSLDEALFTNIDVTSAQFAYSLINIGRDPTTQERLLAEVRSLYEEDISVANFVRREDTFFHKTYLEILRNNPPVWFSLPETTAVEKRIDGFLIPAGTTVIIDTQRLNKTSPIWGENGHEFCPRRWYHITKQQARYSFLEYGMGPRKCLGKNVANVIIKLFLVTVIREFEIAAGNEITRIKRDRFTCIPEQVVMFKKRR